MTDRRLADTVPTMQIPNLGRFLTRHGRFEAFWQETQGSQALPLAQLGRGPGVRLPFYNVRFRLTGGFDVRDLIQAAAGQIDEGTDADPDFWVSARLNKCGLTVARVDEVLSFAAAMRTGIEEAERTGKSPEARQPVVSAWLDCTALMPQAVRTRVVDAPYRARDYYPARLEAVKSLKQVTRRLPPEPIPAPQEEL